MCFKVFKYDMVTSLYMKGFSVMQGPLLADSTR